MQIKKMNASYLFVITGALSYCLYQVTTQSTLHAGLEIKSTKPLHTYKQLQTSALSAWHKHPYLITGSALLGAGIIARWMHQKQQNYLQRIKTISKAEQKSELDRIIKEAKKAPIKYEEFKQRNELKEKQEKEHSEIINELKREQKLKTIKEQFTLHIQEYTQEVTYQTEILFGEDIYDWPNSFYEWSDFNNLMQEYWTLIPDYIVNGYKDWDQLIYIHPETVPTEKQLKTVYNILIHLITENHVFDPGSVTELRTYVLKRAQQSESLYIIENEKESLHTTTYFWATNVFKKDTLKGCNIIGKMLKIIADQIKDDPLFAISPF